MGLGLVVVAQEHERTEALNRQPQRTFDSGNEQVQASVLAFHEFAAHTSAVEIDGTQRAGAVFAGQRQEDAGHLVGGDGRFATCRLDREFPFLGVEAADVAIGDGAIAPVNSRLPGIDLARQLAAPAADAQPFQPQIAAQVGQGQSGERDRFGTGELELGQLFAALRKDQEVAALLVEEHVEVDTPRTGHDLHDPRQIGFALELALDHQIATPGLEAEGTLERGGVVVDPDRQDEIGLGTPGELEFDRGAGGNSKIAAHRDTFLVRDQLSRFLAPAVLGACRRHVLPAGQAVRSQVNEVRAVAPAEDAVNVLAIDLEAPQPRCFDLDVGIVQIDQGAKKDIAGR